MICNLAMPLGLSTIVVPAAYGKDSTAASSMALISHLLSCITIPIIFFFL
jgi:predicted permease